MNVLVCGGHLYRDRRRVFLELDIFHKERAVTLLISGAAKGVDWFGIEWATWRGVDFRGYPAKWKLQGKLAGRARNLRMLKAEMPDLVMAFPGGPGTAHMCQIGEEYGIEVLRVGEGERDDRV